MRILEMITPSRIGGAEIHTARLTAALRAQGEEVTVFCPAGRPFADYLEKLHHSRDMEDARQGGPADAGALHPSHSAA